MTRRSLPSIYPFTFASSALLDWPIASFYGNNVDGIAHSLIVLNFRSTLAGRTVHTFLTRKRGKQACIIFLRRLCRIIIDADVRFAAM